MKKVGLALGGGGARCFAHLGIIKVLQENNIPISFITSSSMGSIIAALIANDVSIENIKEEFYNFHTKLSWLKPKITKNGFMNQSNIKKLLKDLLPQIKIEKTNIPLHIVATNLNTANIHVFKEGDIINAVCASSAFPGIYSPIVINDQSIADGGILNNIPADICREAIGQDNIVISSVLEGSFYNESKKYNNNSFSIVWRAIYIPLIKTREKNVEQNSDIVLKPLEDIEFNFHNWKDILKFYDVKMMESYYQKGKQEMEKKMPQLKKLLTENKNNRDDFCI